MATLALDTPGLADQYDRLSDKQFLHGKALVAGLGIKAGDRVLDVGCGTGRLSAYVADRVGDNGFVAAVDPLPLRIALARSRSRHNLQFSVGSTEDLSEVPGGPFDTAYLNSVFHWVEDQAGALREISGRLKPHGRLGITAASRERPHAFQKIVDEVLSQHRYSKFRHAGTEAPPYKLTVRETKLLLKQTGFQAVSVEIKTFIDYFDSPQTVIDFSASSSFGNFLSDLPEEVRPGAIEEIKGALESRRTSKGIELTRNLIFTVATST